jgi:hypothetical protein
MRENGLGKWWWNSNVAIPLLGASSIFDADIIANT